MNMAILPADEQGASSALRKSLFAERLRALMAARGLTVTETARLLQEHLPDKKFNPVNLSHYRVGRSIPRPRILSALGAILGVSPEELAPTVAAPIHSPGSNDKESAPKLNVVVEGMGPSMRVEPRSNSASHDEPVVPAEERGNAGLGSIPSFNLEDLDGGQAWLQINQRLSWPTVIKILQVLKGEK
ncbi:helix-turn-helix domain-containing protein [Rhodoblastus sp.]|uniref:helix-turn-helix domain-containing protein n=1 Tax=Rhodoblastus sp. TaxID=1962975 RepID=UPI003F9A63B5